MWNYSEKVKEHYTNPRNVGMLEDSNAIGYAGSLACGDAVTLFLKINNEGLVEKAKFLAFGCGSAVAAASILTEIVIGKSIEELSEITNLAIVEALDGLPEEKIHCSVMCKEVLDYAIRDYRKETENTQNSSVCHCFNLTKISILETIKKNNIKDIEGIAEETKATTACGKCKDSILKIIEELEED